MVIQARLSIRHLGCFTESLTGASQGAQLAAGRAADLFSLHGPDPTGLATLLPGAHIVNRSPTSLVLRDVGAGHDVPATIAAGGCTVLWPALFIGGEETYEVLAPSQDALASLLRTLSMHGPARILQVIDAPASSLDVNVPLTDLTSNLTERQLLVLQTAIAEGYYDSPRRTSTEALATTFGVTRSTLEEHLRKAEQRVLQGFAGVLSAQPVLARAAARRPGRPSKLHVR